MVLMCYLAKRSEQVVTKEELMSKLWQGVVVGDEAVTRLIFDLRNVLGDDAKKPQFIETISKKGYRLLVTPQVIKTQVKSQKYRRVVMLLVTAILIGLLMIFFINENELKTSAISEVTSVTNKAGLERHFHINPKTNDLIYVHLTSSSSSQLFFKPQNQGESIQLTESHSRKRSPKWLNEDTFFYIQARQDDYAITRQNLAGKQEDLYSTQNFIYWGSQTKQKLFFTEVSNVREQLQIDLKSINLVTGKIVNLSEKTSQLPDHISFFTVGLNGNRLFLSNRSGQLMSFDLVTKKLQRLESSFTKVTHIEVVNEEILLITGENDAASGIWKINLKNNEQSLLLSSTGGQRIAQAKLHQGKLFYSTYQFDTDIYLYKDGKSLPLQTINTPYNELYPKFINNQNSILFVSNSGGGYDLWRYQLNTSFAERITNLSARRMYPPVISTDGELVAVTYELKGNHIAVVDLTTDIQESNIQTDYQRFPLSWSADKQILYFSEYSDNINLFKTTRDFAKTKLIATNAGLFAYKNEVKNTITFADYVRLGIKTLNAKR
jgi:Tol biopolymer transport system component